MSHYFFLRTAVSASGWFRDLRIREHAELADSGFQGIGAPDPQAFRDVAHRVVWERLRRRAPDSAAALKPLFYLEERDAIEQAGGLLLGQAPEPPVEEPGSGR